MSQKNADRKKKCMETAEMIKGKQLITQFWNFCATLRQGKKCAKSLEIINPIRHFGKKAESMFYSKHTFRLPCKVHCFNNVYDRTGHDTPLLYLCLHRTPCSLSHFRFFVVAARQILIECQDEGKNFLESLLRRAQTKSKQKF